MVKTVSGRRGGRALGPLGVALALVAMVQPARPARAEEPPPNTRILGAQTLYAYVKAGENIDAAFGRENFTRDYISVTLEGPGVAPEKCEKTGFFAPTRCDFLNRTSPETGIWRISISDGAIWNWAINVQEDTTTIPGRVWTEHHRGWNRADTPTLGLWYQGPHGHRYRSTYTNYNAGYSLDLAADATGLAVKGTCVSAYQSIDAGGPGDDTDRFGRPAPGECGEPYRIFFAEPAADLPETATRWDGTTTWVARTPATPQITNLRFTPEGDSARRGTFAFDVADFTGQLTLQVDATGDGDYDDPEDVTIPTFAKPGTVEVAFDGLDGTGAPLSPWTVLKAKASIGRSGEIHLVQNDLELRHAVEVEALNGPNAGSTTLYWNDTLLDSADRACTTPVLDGLAGVDSAGGVHGWTCNNDTNNGVTGSWGDFRFIEDWTFAAADVALELDVPGLVAVEATADPATVGEPGGPVLFSVAVRNNGTVDGVTLESLSDDRLGNVTATGGKITETTCAVPQTIAAGDTYRCTFRADVAGDAAEVVTDVVTATLRNAGGETGTATGEAAVTLTDVKPGLVVDSLVAPGQVVQPGGPVTFKVTVTNPSGEPVTLTALADDRAGALDGKGDCALPQTIAPAGSYSCSFSETVTGAAGTTQVATVTGTASDNEGNEVTDQAAATVRFLAELPEVVVDIGASPSEVPDPGGRVTYTVAVTNPPGDHGPIDVTALTDSRFGNIGGLGTCDLSPPVSVAPGASYTCSFTRDLTGSAGAVQSGTVTVTALDAEGRRVSGSADAAVTITDALPGYRGLGVTGPSSDATGPAAATPDGAPSGLLPATGGPTRSLTAYGIALLGIGALVRRRRRRLHA